MKEEVTEAQWLLARDEIPVEQLAELTGCSIELLQELVEHGALAPNDPNSTHWTFAPTCIHSVCAARRLHDDFELDANATSLALTLIGQIHRLEIQVQVLQSQIPKMGKKA